MYAIILNLARCGAGVKYRSAGVLLLEVVYLVLLELGGVEFTAKENR